MDPNKVEPHSLTCLLLLLQNIKWQIFKDSMGNLHGKNGDWGTKTDKMWSQDSLSAALEAGYRGIDTAAVYRFALFFPNDNFFIMLTTTFGILVIAFLDYFLSTLIVLMKSPLLIALLYNQQSIYKICNDIVFLKIVL